MESALWVAPDLVGARLVAARPVTWRGRGELCQCPWMKPLRGSWLIIECWAGVGGLALALLSMGVHFWSIAAECSEAAVQVSQACMPQTVHIERMEDLRASMLIPFLKKRKVRGIIMGGGSPCQGNSALNCNRLGLSDARSQQPALLTQLRKDIADLPEAEGLEIFTFLENVASMQPSVLAQYNDWMGGRPVKVAAAGCGWTQRNRLLWLVGSRGAVSPQLQPPADWDWVQPRDSGVPFLSYMGKKPIPSKVAFADGFRPLTDPVEVVKAKGEGAMYPFTREFWHPCDRVSEASSEAVARFHDDARRFPPGAYEAHNLLWKKDQWRTLSPEERSQLMGWPAHLTDACPGRGEQRRQSRNSLVGNGFHLPTLIAVLCMIPQLLEAKLPSTWSLSDEKALHHRLVHTVWEPGYLEVCPQLSDAQQIVSGMQAIFAEFPVPEQVWNVTSAALARLDLHLLQAYVAWQIRRGHTCECLGPHPMLASDRALVFAGLSGQRWSSEATRGLDPLLPPGLGKTDHLAEAQCLSNPFQARGWPEEDVQFVLMAMVVWQERLPAYVDAQRKLLKQVVGALAPLEASLNCFRVPSSHRVASEKRPGFAAFLTSIMRWPDIEQPVSFITGYKIVGQVALSGVFRPADTPAAADVDEWLGEAAVQAVERIMRSPPPLFQTEIWTTTQEEQAKGFCGPLRSRQWMDRKYGVGLWRPLERFLIRQADNKLRVIDNAKKTGHNAVTEMCETITTTSVDFISAVTQDFLQQLGISSLEELHRYPWFQPPVGTDDLPDAYRGLPVAPAQQGFSIIAICHPLQGWQFLELWGLAFGLQSAVTHFNRFPLLGIAGTRRLLCGLCSAYFDDELSMEFVKDHDTSQRSLQLIFRSLGAAPQASKTFPPAENRVYLGSSIHTGDVCQTGCVLIQPKTSTSQKVLDFISASIGTGNLSAEVAGKLRGDLQWMFTHCTGHLGKFAGPLLARAQSHTNLVLDSAALDVLSFLELIVCTARPRAVPVFPTMSSHILCYSDASFEENELRMGWVVFKEQCSPVGYSCVVPPEEIATWQAREQQIYVGESLAILTALRATPSLFAQRAILWFLDNQASLSSLIRGTSTQDDVHELVQGVHLTLHQLSCRCWWEWVDTESNVSDGLSRGGVLDPWTMSQQWDLHELPFPPSASRIHYLTPLEA